MFTQRYHSIIDIDVCNVKISDRDLLETFVKLVATTVDMNIIAGPLVAEGIPLNPGFSAIAIVDFSHISIHTFTKYNEVLIDVFSCKPYDRLKLLAVCKEYFATESSNVREKEVWWG